MHKRKDGTVIASLTEVKNKTGDIFSLVDEFGEVVLTSYNKPKYKISKVDISETLTLSEEKESKPKATKKKSVVSRAKNVVASTFSSSSKPETKTTTLLSEEVLSKLTKLKAWDRSSRKEMAFVSKAKKPLQ